MTLVAGLRHGRAACGPGIVFCQALHAGVAEIELFTGDPWRQTDSRFVQLIVE